MPLKHKQSNTAIYAYSNEWETIHHNFDVIDLQIESCHDYATNDGEIVANAFIDRWHSRTNTTRPGYRLLIAAIEEGEVDRVLVHNFSILSLSAEETIELIYLMQKHDVQLESVTESNSTITPNQKVHILLRLAITEDIAKSSKSQH